MSTVTANTTSQTAKSIPKTKEDWVAQVVSYDSGKVIKTVPSTSKRTADRVSSGMDINLNHDKFYTRVRDLAAQPKEKA